MGKDELKACPIHKGECLTHWNIIKHDHDLFQGECRTDCGLVYLTAHKDFYEDAKRSLFSVWNTRPNDAKWISVEDFVMLRDFVLKHGGILPLTGRIIQILNMPLPTPPKQSSEGDR